MRIREHFASDIRFYNAVGVVIALFFVGLIGGLAALNVIAIDRRLVPFVVGFFIFMAVYFLSVQVLRLMPDEADRTAR